jgi:hypothetical protein
MREQTTAEITASCVTGAWRNPLALASMVQADGSRGWVCKRGSLLWCPQDDNGDG